MVPLFPQSVCTSMPPRLASIEPSPVLANVCQLAAPGFAVSAAGRLTRPAPWTFTDRLPIGEAVPFRTAFTWSGVYSGWALTRRATRPEVTAVASDVPLPLM